MSQQLVSLNDDLRRLRDEGYDIEARSTGYLVVRDVPYVNSRKELKRGTLVTELSLAGDKTTAPGTHVIYFAGDYPSHSDGSEIAQIKHQSGRQTLDRDLAVDHSFSNKPEGGYSNHYEKITTYVNIISGPARTIDASATAQTFPLVEAESDESIFEYYETASSRAGIAVITRKLELARIGIVGLGGTGSYVLDLVAKTPVREIHLFDADKYSQHNAFRSPGAPSKEELAKRPTKVAYLKALYSRMHRGIVAHEEYVGPSNVESLRGMEFVFLCLDRGDARRLIIDHLEEYGIAFVDVGMGVYRVDDALGGVLRVTTSTTKHRGHVRSRVSFADTADNEYARNIQIADLNALNATLAVIKWKKLFGFYYDFEKEHHTTYSSDCNLLTSDDQNEA